MEELHSEYKAQNKEDEFVLWFNMTYVESTIDTIIASVPNPFLKKMITENGYATIVENKLRDTLGQNNIKLEITVNADTKPSDIITEAVENVKEQEKKEEELLMQKESSSFKTVETSSYENEDYDGISNDSSVISSLNNKNQSSLLKPEYNFETFIQGENSNYAYNASIAVAKNPGKLYNPLLLYGGSGLGKTHLMQAIGNYIYSNSPEKLKINYVSAETFGNDFTSSLTKKNVQAFKDKYRKLDLLLLDDIHFLQGKEGMQNELFYTFEALSQRNVQMVFTCDRPLKEIKNMTERLVSRLGKGLSIDLQPPNYETRIAILKKKLELQGRILDSEIIEYIAQNVETNVRELEAALNKIIGYAELIGSRPTLDVVKSQLKDLLSTNIAENVTLDTIMNVVANNYNISISDLKGKKRDKKIVVPRQIAIYIARDMTEYSYIEIGNEFGGRDHTTIMHAYDRINDMKQIDPSLEAKIELYEREIREYKKS